MSKKIYLFIAVILALAGSAYKTQAQTTVMQINAHYEVDSCIPNGTTTPLSMMQFYIYCNATNSNSSVQTFFGDGSSATATAWGQGSYHTSHNYTAAGIYSARHILFDNGTPVDTVDFSVDVNCNGVTLIAYNETGSNCIQNAGESYLYSLSEVEVQINNVPVDTLSFYGQRHYPITSNTNYKFRYLNPPSGASILCPSGGTSATINVTGSFNVVPVYFGFACGSSTSYDLGVSYTGFFRPVNFSYIHVYADNAACVPTSGVVTLQVNPKYSVAATYPTATSVTGNTVTWNTPALSTLSTPNGGFHVTLVPATGAVLNIGDTICNVVSITPTSGDINLANNTDAHCDSVRTSFDPNDKQVLPLGDIRPGTRLTYTINFENLGNDTAFNIHIMDTLSNLLDVSSFEFLGSSHAARPYFYTAGGSNIIKFDLPNIRLADKNNPAHNKGFVKFSIKAKAGLANGTLIANRAGIYFDINPVVLTNTAYKKIGTPQSVTVLSTEKRLSIYPNPATSQVTVELYDNSYDQVQLTNAMGQVLYSQPVQKGNNTIATGQLPAGIYYLLLQGAHGSHAEKIEKK